VQGHESREGIPLGLLFFAFCTAIAPGARRKTWGAGHGIRRAPIAKGGASHAKSARHREGILQIQTLTPGQKELFYREDKMTHF